MFPGLRAQPSARPKVGMVLAFTGHYPSVRILAEFLKKAGVDLVTSDKSQPAVLQAGSTLASSDFCVPLRTYIGHVHHLVDRHPDLDYLVVPNLHSENEMSAMCAKYRDISGAVIRSLAETLGYNLKEAPRIWRRVLAGLLGKETVEMSLERSQRLPRVIHPTIHSVRADHLFNLCFDLYREIHRLPRSAKLALFLPRKARPRLAPWLAHVEEAFAEAYATHRPDAASPRLEAFWRRPDKPRLALVGRRYLLHDDSLSADLRRYFLRAGVNVVTAADVPFSELLPYYERVEGYYDSHKEGQALIDWAAPHVDGFIAVGSFGCHPDAFQTDVLAEHARSLGKPAWTFRYDETVGQTGFITRYETILTFLEKERDRRLARQGHSSPAAEPAERTPLADPTREPRAEHGSTLEGPTERQRPGPLPLLIWPNMGEILDLLVLEFAHQTGLEKLVVPPAPVSEETIRLGNTHFTESCSPYALSTGSLVQTIRQALRRLEDEARQEGRPVEPRRIVVLMLRGEGPCTFGWYALAQNRILPQTLKEELASAGHTLELATVGLDGVGDFVRQLANLGNRENLRDLLVYVEAWERGFERLGRWRRWRVTRRLWRLIGRLYKVLWTKLEAAEALRADSLLRRAHELEPGSIQRAYRQGLDLLAEAHSPREIRRALAKARRLLAAVPQDAEPKPRVVAVGEIYVALTSFANRGAVENLLGRQGIEVVEGIRISDFARGSLAEMKRRARVNHPWLRPLLRYLARFDIHLMGQRVRDRAARPFILHEVGGEGLPSVAKARRQVEKGVQGILHVYPFKCMPEELSKDALKEIGRLYGVRYLGLSFDKETDIERLKTEISTFATLLRSDLAAQGVTTVRERSAALRRIARRRRLVGWSLNRVHAAARRGSYFE